MFDCLSRRVHARAIRIVLLAASLVLTSCFERDLAAVDPCTRTTVGESVRVEGIDSLDLLFMIDSSPTMVEEQQALREQIPRLVQILTTGDLEAGTTRAGAGIMDFQPIASMHVGVITQDGGGLGRAGPGICPSMAGDDGLLSMPEATTRRIASAGCPASGLPLFLDFTRGVTDPSALTAQVTCQTQLGTGGCGFEQPLEMIMKSLADPSYVPPSGPYQSGTPSHGGTGENAGFLRPNSVLAIVVVTDEDDGSVSNAEIFDQALTFTPNDINVRVAFNPDHAFDVQRYVDALRVVEPDPSRLVVITIAGVPADLVDDTTSGEGSDNLAGILADPRMTIVQSSNPGYLVASCSSASGEAYPARRLVDFTQRVGGVVQSICQTDFGPAIDVLVNRIANALGGTCLPRQLNPDADGNVDCSVVEVLPSTGPTTHCADLPEQDTYELARIERGVDDSGAVVEREVCRVRQVGRAGAGGVAGGVVPGWVYDDGTLGAFSELPAGCMQRIAFSALMPIGGADIRLECSQTILPASGEAAQLGSFCDPATGIVSRGTVTCGTGHAVAGNPTTLACDAFDRTCQVPCSDDAQCVAAGLLSYVCDHRDAATVFAGVTLPTGVQPGDTHDFCVNPTCN
jgi:hypothetical protein